MRRVALFHSAALGLAFCCPPNGWRRCRLAEGSSSHISWCVCTAQWFLYLHRCHVCHEAPPCRALRAPSGRTGASAAVACLTAATGRCLGASARLGVAIVASATRLDSTLSHGASARAGASHSACSAQQLAGAASQHATPLERPQAGGRGAVRAVRRCSGVVAHPEVKAEVTASIAVGESPKLRIPKKKTQLADIKVAARIERGRGRRSRVGDS